MKLPSTFRFSPVLTFGAIALAILMCVASRWQWTRYKYKVALLESYQNNEITPPIEIQNLRQLTENLFSTDSEAESKVDSKVFMNKKVSLIGKYDYEHQIIILNRQHATGPGAWLMTPLRMEDGSSIFISRGFIPYADVISQNWRQYDFSPIEKVIGIVSPAIAPKSDLVPASLSSADSSKGSWTAQWLYPDLKNIAEQYPYPVNTDVFLQRVGGPPVGQFPAESIQIDVPPSTHFGYTFEWIFLAIMTLVISFLVQAFPRQRPHSIQTFEKDAL